MGCLIRQPHKAFLGALRGAAFVTVLWQKDQQKKIAYAAERGIAT
jgi:hypothetical protein